MKAEPVGKFATNSNTHGNANANMSVNVEDDMRVDVDAAVDVKVMLTLMLVMFTSYHCMEMQAQGPAGTHAPLLSDAGTKTDRCLCLEQDTTLTK